MSINSIIRKVKLGQTPFYRWARSVLKLVVRPVAPRLPNLLKPLLRMVYEMHFMVIRVVRLGLTVFYRHPLFQARCASVGKRLSIDGLPFVSGHVEIHVGNDVWLGGNLSIACGRSVERPKLVIGDRSEISWNVELVVSREIVIEEDVRIASRCRLSDTDGHPREADLRANNTAVKLRDIRAVRICRYAWIGHSAHIMKGVTVGEGAIIAANSVVITDVPPYSLAMGNPAEVYFRNFGRPSNTPPAPAN